MKNKKLLAIGTIGACAVCCAPLLAPLVAAAGTAGVAGIFGLKAFGLSADQVLCGSVALAASVAAGFWLWRRRQKTKHAGQCECETACDLQTCVHPKPA